VNPSAPPVADVDPDRVRGLLAAAVSAALAAGGIPVQPSPEEPLISSGAIDSMALTALLQQFGERLGLEVEPLDVTLENFDTLARMEAFVLSRLRGRGQGGTAA
jgi:acyl carrier protein